MDNESQIKVVLENLPMGTKFTISSETAQDMNLSRSLVDICEEVDGVGYTKPDEGHADEWVFERTMERPS